MVNITIFDWDDTLFPTTSYITNKNQNYKLLDTLVYSVLSYYISISHVYIVTNASIKWVYISSRLIPNTHELIKKHIKILSGRDTYSNISSDNYLWKKLLFNKIIDQYNINQITNIISIGDADYEYQALINLYNKHNQNILYKNIKLLKHPKPNILFEQLKLLQQSSPKIINHNTHLDTMYKYKSDVAPNNTLIAV